MSDSLSYHRHLASIATQDVNYVLSKDTQYAGSWKRRGGVGAWFTIVRPWDRLAHFVEDRPLLDDYGRETVRYDIFEWIREQGLEGPDGSVIACVRDLRRYLLLVEAHMTEELEKPPLGDNHFSTPFPIGTMTVEIPGMSAEAVMDLARRSEEKLRPGTPEDGGQHAGGLYPWVAAWGQVSGAGPQCWDAWSGSGNTRQLEPRVTPQIWHALPTVVKACYAPVFLRQRQMDGGLYALCDDAAGDSKQPVDETTPHAYWLRVEHAPPQERDRWRTLSIELNQHEWSGAGDWGELYDWHQEPGKFILRQARQAWAETP